METPLKSAAHAISIIRKGDTIRAGGELHVVATTKLIVRREYQKPNIYLLEIATENDRWFMHNEVSKVH